MFGDKRLDLNVIHPIAGYFVKPTPTNPNIIVGDFSYIAVSEFESHVKHHYEWTGDKLIIGYKDQGINTNGTAFCFFGGRTLDFHEIAAVGYCHLESNAGIVFLGDRKIVAEGFEMELPQDIFDRLCEEKATCLVDISETPFEKEIVLSDEQMEHVIRINSKRTMDRGYITTIK